MYIFFLVKSEDPPTPSSSQGSLQIQLSPEDYRVPFSSSPHPENEIPWCAANGHIVPKMEIENNSLSMSTQNVVSPVSIKM